MTGKVAEMKIILTIILFVVSSIAVLAIQTCNDPFCEKTAGFPLPIILFTDYGPPIDIFGIIFDLLFWYVIVSIAFFSYPYVENKFIKKKNNNQQIMFNVQFVALIIMFFNLKTIFFGIKRKMWCFDG